MSLPPTPLDRFVLRAEEAGSTITYVEPTRLAEFVLELASPEDRVVVAPSALSAWPQLRAVGPMASDGAGQHRFPFGVVAASLAVAETGSTAVDETNLSDREVSMNSETLVRVVSETAVVSGLEEFAVWAESHRQGYVALITGPSRTADIERSLTIGVQGPRHDHVVVVSA